MARERDDDYEDDADADERPSRRRGGSGVVDKPGGMDGFMGNLPIVIIVSIVVSLCCSCIPIILGGVGLATTKTPEGKRGSMIMLGIGLAFLLLGVILQVAGVIDAKQFQK